jgi:hypothetical protein
LRAIIAFLETLTCSPKRIKPEDVIFLQTKALTERAIVDAIYVCAGFDIIVRIANAFDFKVPPPKAFKRSARFLLIFGYGLLSGEWFRTADSRHIHSENHLQRSDEVGDPYRRKLMQLKEAVFFSQGVLAPSLRIAISEGKELPGTERAYVEKIMGHAYTVTDEDIEALHGAGYSDDHIFEATVSAALGAGLIRLESGLNALRTSKVI